MTQNQIRSTLRKAKKQGKLLVRQIRSDAKWLNTEFKPLTETFWGDPCYFKASKYYLFKQVDEQVFQLNNHAFAVQFKIKG